MILPRLHLPRVTRTHLVGLLIFGAGLAVCARLVQLMVTQHTALAAIAKSQSEDKIEIPGPRGDIVDRYRNVLATSLPVKVLAVEPRKLTQAGLRALEQATNTPGRLTQRATARWLEVRRDCDAEMVAAVQALAKAGVVKDEALHWAPGFKRYYPHQQLASHVLGFVSIDEKFREGVEKKYEDMLRSGERRVLRIADGKGTALGDLGGSAMPAASTSVMLTIDLRIQQKLEEALEKARTEHGAKGAQGIVLDPATGEVLALANVPSYDPNNYGRAETIARRNLAIEVPFEPGSVMKPLTATALAEYSQVNDTEQVYCEMGHWKRGKWTLGDTHPHGWLTLPEVIAYSSNIGIAKFAARVPAEKLYDTFLALGLGHRTGIDLPAEVGGQVKPWKEWRGVDRDVMAFGHSIMLTTLQLATAYATIANGGVRVQPHVVRALGSPDGEWHRLQDAPRVQAISKKAAERVALLMLNVVEMENATGKSARVTGYRVAGKTGTAEKIGKNGRYEHGKNIGTFAGFAPLTHPAAVVVISLDEPTVGAHTGGIVAAPAFAEVMDETLRLLRVAPDYVPEPPPAPAPAATTAPLPAMDAKSTKAAPAASAASVAPAASAAPAAPAGDLVGTPVRKPEHKGRRG